MHKDTRETRLSVRSQNSTGLTNSILTVKPQCADKHIPGTEDDEAGKEI